MISESCVAISVYKTQVISTFVDDGRDCVKIMVYKTQVISTFVDSEFCMFITAGL